MTLEQLKKQIRHDLFDNFFTGLLAGVFIVCGLLLAFAFLIFGR